MRRIYTSTAHFRAPYDTANISFAGLGVLGSDHRAYDANRWPARRSYFDVSQYRAPLRAGYYQSGALRGAEAPEAQASMTGAQKWTIVAVILGSIALGVLGDKLKA